MRDLIIEEIYKFALQDDSIILITGDLGYGVLNLFAQTFPDRFINVGISEQAMASVAAGMALEGMKVYMYSIANFCSLRCIEQIRNNICYHNANVKILSVGSGFAYGQLGMSHHATEDIAMMRSLPNMRVYSPADTFEAKMVISNSYIQNGPCYIRIAKNEKQQIHNQMITNQSIIRISKGTEVCILSTGTIVNEAILAAEILKMNGIDTGVYSVPIIKPLDNEKLNIISRKCKLLVTLEEHNITGGLGGAVAEVLGELSGDKAVLFRMGLKDIYSSIVGDEQYLRKCYKLSGADVAAQIKEKYEDINCYGLL